MKKLMLLCGVAILAISVSGMVSPAYAQFDSDIDLTPLLNGTSGGNNRGNNNRNFQIPDSRIMYDDIVKILKDGKTPLEKEQQKPLKSLLDTEIVTLTDKIQVMRNNQNNNQNNQNASNNPRGGQTGNTPQFSEQAIKIDAITSVRNEEFLTSKISLFLSPEQVALVQKARADDKANSNCLGGLLDRYYNQMNSSNNNNNNNRGNNNFNNNNNNNNSNNNNQLRPNGQKYCMTTQVTAAERLEPIRKVLAKGNMPLAKDKETLAEVVMNSELKDLDSALRAGLTSNNNNNNNRGNNNNNNRNNDPRVLIQTTKDGMQKKIQEMLKPEQAATMKRWHYTEMLGRTPIDSLIAVNAMQDTPLSEAKIAEITAAWPLQREAIQKAAKAAGKQVDAKTIDAAAMSKILDMLEPSQVVSYQLAKKYGPEAAAGK